MRIVMPTEPPSMAVIVDTVVFGEVTLSVHPADLTKSRIDIVFAKEGTVGILQGASRAPSNGEPAPPARATGMRELARLHIGATQAAVWWRNIEKAL